MPGTLFVVATPIGNLEDLTFRALRILQEVDAVAAEDTRRTSKLLAHYGVSKPLVSLHAHNEHRQAPGLVDRMLRGESLALVSDAGTPAISDPGATLVSLAREAAVRIVPIPGPSAIVAALSVSGIPATPFTFLGFPPSSGQARDRWFESLEAAHHVVVFFESPHRIRRTLQKLLEDYPERPINVHRELTKIHEDLALYPSIAAAGSQEVVERGEFVVIVGAASQPGIAEDTPCAALELFDQISAATSLPDEKTQRAVSAITGLAPSKVRQMVKKARILVKRQTEAAP